jgi:pilus assembly protein CpaB
VVQAATAEYEAEEAAFAPRLVAARRRRLSDRLSLGHVIMVTAGLLAFVLVMTLLGDRAATVRVIAADREILPGSVVTPEMVREVELPADSELVGAIATMASIEAGDVTAGQRIGVGEPITIAALAPASAPSGLRAMSIPIEREFAVGGALAPGDRVDVISVSGGKAGYIAVDLEILETQRASARTGALAVNAAGSYFVVVAVDDQTALRLALAIEDDAISVLRSTGAAVVDPAQRTLVPADDATADDATADDGDG